MSAVAHIDTYKTGQFFRDDFRGDMSWNGYEYNILLRNRGLDKNGIPHFSDVAKATGADSIADSRGLALLDFDNDGDLDFVINNNPGDHGLETIPPTLLRNDIGQGRQWLAVELEGRTSNRDAVGAEVTAIAGEIRAMRLVSAGNGYASQHGRRLYFGLDEADQVDTLEVRWPGGELEVFEDLPSSHLVRITEGEGLEVLLLPGSEDAD